MELNVNDFIPQRYPFEMIDKIVAVTPGEKAEAQKNLTTNEWYFSNGNPLTLPHPIIIESLAQTGVVAILSMPEHRGHNVFFGGIKQAEFYAEMRPGDVLQLKVHLTKLKRNVGVGHGKVLRDGEVIVAADLMFAIEA
ncbi:beta-hydroxyacyl-ACP dehydratase [Fructilactobacillus myrtifloralis]|uniref:Beta-hydroxyacyl-ACP dehydratase n=1 Tax=Fructilactobacillus myrtifloralis TaxID=2940301 RepID=A0ABY5BNJ6_9LACO|nr:3-hydroxyacyl-ACP dehydratase FabZ family protein [Fructilactobacillus myrtifloralis]USS84781.1 beta-hydroxyacyl-ACP dehydratase [Fructilactobacillus myrtifloralis]